MHSPEFRFLLHACRLDEPEAATVRAQELIEKVNPDWDDLLLRASFHRVEPQVSELIGKLPESLIPPGVKERLRESVQRNLVGQIRYVSEFFRIREWLGEEGVAVVPFKGFWLGGAMYGNLAARVSSDIDLFVDYNDLEKIKQVMSGKGYLGHTSLEELTEEYIQDELAEYNFDRYDEGVCQAHVEFHWRSTMRFYRMGVTLDDLKPQIITGVLQGRELKVFSPAANLLLLVMHHGGKECYWQLRQILDIAHIIRTSPDLDYEWLLEQAGRFHLHTLLLVGVRLAHDLTGIDVPVAIRDILKERKISRMARGRIRLMSFPVDRLALYKDRVASWMFKIRSRDGFRVRIHLCRHTVLKVVAPRIVPKQWRNFFFNRKIRRTNFV